MLIKSGIKATHLFITLLIAIQAMFFCQLSTAAPVQMSGFFSTGITDANADNTILRNNQIENKTNYLADTVFGLQLWTLLSKEARFSAQLIALDKNNSFDVEAEWLFVSHQVSSNIELRAGRLRLPTYLVSETILVGQSYDWVRPPMELLTLTGGLNRYNGFSSIYKYNIGSASVEAELYIGQMKDSVKLEGFPTKLNSKQMYGGQLSYSTDNFVIRASQMDAKVLYNIPSLGIELESPISVKVVGMQFNRANAGGSWEWGTLQGNRGDLRALYASLFYTLDRWTPIFTYGASNTDSNWGTANYKGETITLGCRYDFSETHSLKAQVLRGELIDSIALIFTPPATGFDDKITVYSLSLNMVF
ncbi:MAG: hypothetical protein JKY67_21140 [Pseudomonadales bacterium]|nr:hypothetical protein [Pseudomonadales bacterium]